MVERQSGASVLDGDVAARTFVSVRSGQSVQPDVMTNVQTPFYLRRKGPAEVYASAVVTQ